MTCPEASHLIGLTEEDMMAGTHHAAIDCPVRDGYIQRWIKDAAVANPWFIPPQQEVSNVFCYHLPCALDTGIAFAVKKHPL